MDENFLRYGVAVWGLGVFLSGVVRMDGLRRELKIGLSFILSIALSQ